MAEAFDDLSKALARSTTRREALRRIGGFFAGALFASLGLEPSAWARGECRRQICGPPPRRRRGETRQQYQERRQQWQECMRDCDACKKACHGIDSACFEECGGCRESPCEALFPRGPERDFCVLVCAQCMGAGTAFCVVPSAAGPVARCCGPGLECCETDPGNSLLGTCVDLSTDPEHCGGCLHACPPGSACIHRDCTGPGGCPAGREYCGKRGDVPQCCPAGYGCHELPSDPPGGEGKCCTDYCFAVPPLGRPSLCCGPPGRPPAKCCQGMRLSQCVALDDLCCPDGSAFPGRTIDGTPYKCC